MRQLVFVLSLFLPESAWSQVAKQDMTAPNVYGEASENLLQLFAERSVDQTGPFSEHAGDATVHGTVRATAKARIEMIPNARQAEMHIVIDGAAYVHATVFRKPVRLCVSTVLRFEGRSPLLYAKKGFNHSPVTVCGGFADTRLHCVATQFRGPTDRVAKRITRFIFNRQIDAKLAQALPEALAKIRTSFDKESVPEMEKLNKDYDVLLQVAKNAHVNIKRLESSTTAERLFVRWVIATPNQPAAKTPPRVTGKSDLAFRVHESVLNETAKANLAGKDITIRELQQILGPLAAAMKPDPKAKRWRILFVKEKPATVRFADDQISLVLRTREIGTDANLFKRPMIIRVRYRIEKSRKGIDLVRIGRVDPIPPWFKLKPGQNYPPAIQKDREWIRKSFENTFGERVTLKPGILKRDKKEVGRLVPTEFHTEAGWLAASWVQIESDQPK